MPQSTSSTTGTSTTTSITSTLSFTGNALAAAQYYTSIFPSSHIVSITNYPDNPSTPPSMSSSTPMLITITLFANISSPLNLLLLNVPFDLASSFPFKFNESFSISIVVDTQAEIDDYWAKLVADGGEEKSCCWCKDKFGVHWQIVPRALIKAMEGGGETAVKAQSVMLTWKKADLAMLEKALTGGV